MDGIEFVRICNPKKSKVMAVAVRGQLWRFGVPFTQAGESVGVAVASPRTPHRTAEPTVRGFFSRFQPLNLWGQIFSLGSGSGVATAKSADFTAFSQELYIGVIRKKGVVILGR